MKDESDIIVEGTCINAIIYNNVEHNQYGYEIAKEPPGCLLYFQTKRVSLFVLQICL